jgi:hypothetical protein
MPVTCLALGVAAKTNLLGKLSPVGAVESIIRNTRGMPLAYLALQPEYLNMPAGGFAARKG